MDHVIKLARSMRDQYLRSASQSITRGSEGKVEGFCNIGACLVRCHHHLVAGPIIAAQDQDCVTTGCRGVTISGKPMCMRDTRRRIVLEED